MATNRRLSARLATVLGAAALTVVLAATGASAVNVYAYEGSDMAYGEWQYLTVCDKERDGNGVYARYELVDGNSGRFSDPDGSAGECGKRDFGRASNGKRINVKRFRVCEDDFGDDTCGAWQAGYPGRWDT